ncbi:MAG: restriction endonuclease, partial [Blastocatellia bacterium]|nr:restriction endonuclease [Blastocatellia bacterium]
HVYEGLLDHTAVRARVTVIGLSGTKDNHPEVVLEELLQRSGDELVAYLKALTGRSESAIRNGLNVVLDQQEEAKFKRRCEFDESLWQQIKPFAALIRKDYLEHPVIITPHSIYVTQGEDRRSTGTHYTPRSLTEPIVEYTLEPAVYVGIAEGLPKQDWKLKSAKELLELKICDVAMGSGAFLVQACRYLATKLVEAWNNIKAANPNKVIVAPEGELSEGAISEEIIPQDPTEKLLEAMRIVADRCLYGVDKNPMAVEMGKLSLWLVTLQKRKPFTFLDHALRCGDSLLGVTKSQQIEFFHLQPETKMVKPFGGDFLKESLENIVNKRTQIEHIRTESRQDLDYKEKLLKEIEQDVEQASLIADLLVGEFLKESGQIKPESFAAKELSAVLAEINNKLLKEGSVSELQDKAKKLLGSNKPFHWLLEFPEVFWKDDAGFDAIISNPPFLGGKKITGTSGVEYREYLVEQIGKGVKGNADLSAYFFLRASSLLNKSGGFGMLATNTIAQGDTREVGLDQLVAEGAFIQRAIPSRKWPGVANLEVAQVWIRNGVWKSECYLDEKPVNQISAFLTVPSRVAGNPYRLAANQSKSFQGSIVLGMGFVMTPEEAQALIAKDQKNRDVLFPYLNGEDLNSRPDQSPSRWVINFRDWPLDRESAPKDYKGSVAADYPDCLKIIEEKVKPERTRVDQDGNFVLRKPLPQKWWIYADKRPELYSTIEAMEYVLCKTRHSSNFAFQFVKTEVVFQESLVIFVANSYFELAACSSTLHEIWALQYSSTLGGYALRYSPSDCFETFPFPENIDSLEAIGESYYKHRQEVMATNGEGLTKTYNRFHNPEDKSAEIERLRQLHVEMDCKVAAAYGWQDLNLGHGFHQTKQGLRFTISEDARREVLDRLLELNHQRYAKELAEGLYDKSKKKPANRKTKKTEVEKIAQESLF